MDTVKPLAGLRVVDFTWIAAGPLGTRILANFGAQVIKVESRAHMDSLRYDLRPRGSTSENTSAIFAQVNPGKLSVSLDLSRDEGRDLVRRLIATADLVTNNFRPGALERIGLGYEALREIKPDIVLLNMPGCGREGPWSQVATMGNLVLAASGWNSLTGFAGQPPRGLGTPFPDFTAPFILIATVLAALRERDRTGAGQELDLSQLSATVSLLGVEWMQFVSTGKQPPRRANRDPNYCPHGVYPTSGEDEWCAIAARGDRDWAELCGLMGRPELSRDERFATHDSRKAHEDEIDAIVSQWTQAQDRWELAGLLQAHRIAAAAVEDLRDLLETDPLVGHFQRVDSQPSDPEVEHVIDGEPIRFAGVDRPLTRAPMFGEHNEYVLRELAGLTMEQFDRLVVEGASIDRCGAISGGTDDDGAPLSVRGTPESTTQPAPDGPGGPHDDNVARTLGYRRALVPGEAVTEAVMPAIVARFGTRFMEGGWLSLKNIAPTYVDEEVREIGESVAGSPDVLDLRLETMEGRPTCVGRAGLGGIASGTPWRAEEDGTHGAEIAHPELALSTEYPDLWFIHDKAEVAVCRDAGGDETPWFRGPSPWGGPVSPPLVLTATSLHVGRRLPEGTATAGNPATLSELFASFQAKNAVAEARRLLGMSQGGADLSEPGSGAGLARVEYQHEIVVERPMFQEMPYVMSSRQVDKGVARSGRSWFSTLQFEVRDSAGILYATARTTRRTLLVKRGE